MAKGLTMDEAKKAISSAGDMSNTSTHESTSPYCNGGSAITGGGHDVATSGFGCDGSGMKGGGSKKKKY